MFSSRYFESKFPADPRFIGHTRKRLKVIFDTEWRIALTARIEDYLVSVGEAIANAIQHGSSSRDSIVGVTARHCPVGILIVEVADRGPGFDLAAVVLEPTPEDEHGRGHILMAAGCDSYGYCRRDGEFICSLVKTI